MNDRQRLDAIVSVVCKYLPPDGTPIKDAMSEIISLVDPLPPAAQPSQGPDMLTIAYQSGYYDGKKAALAGREWNFCERCGKRTADLTTIHTCTPAAQPALPVRGPSLQEQLDKASADLRKADADLHKASEDWDKAIADLRKASADLRKASADRDKADAEVERLQQLIEEKNT